LRWSPRDKTTFAARQDNVYWLAITSIVVRASPGVIRFLMELARKLPDRVIALHGNHEMMALAAADGATPPPRLFGRTSCDNLSHIIKLL